MLVCLLLFFFFSSRRRHTRYWRDWSSDVCSSDLGPLGSAHQSQAPYQAFRTADGWITIGANTPNTWAGLCRTLSMEEQLDDERYADATKRHALREELRDLIETRTTGRTTADLEAALGAAGVPCAPINDYGQVFTDDHLTTRGFFWDRSEERRVGKECRSR